jgi:hypothetical protein
MKNALATILKAVAGLAGVVFLMAPVTDMGVIVSMIALAVAITTGIMGVHLSDDDRSNNDSGYWPKDPHSPN